MTPTNCNAKRAIRRNQAAGYHYFDPATMDVFGSIVHKAYEGRDGTYYVVMSNRYGEEDDLSHFRYHLVIAVGLDGQATRIAGELTSALGIDMVKMRLGAWTFNQADIYARARAAQ